MTWLFEISLGLVVVAALMAPLFKLLAPSWGGVAVVRAKARRLSSAAKELAD